jgi:DNA polymerase-1
MSKKLVVIDGNSLLFRAYYATAYGDPSSIMRTKDGTPTNAIFAFGNMIAKILQGFKGGESIFVGFDKDKETFRAKEFEGYKANRQPCPPELKPQFPISRELLDALGIAYYEEHGYEADDICGTVATKASKDGYDVIIYTSDHDYLQLINPHVKVSLLKTGLSKMALMDEEALMAETGLTPKQVIDYKGLRGDASDNYPGIPGVGEKTAKKLIQEYGSFEGVVEHAGEIKGKLGENIRANVESGRESYRLATILTDLDLPFDEKSLEYQGYEFKKVADFAKKYELRQFLARLPSALKKGSAEKAEVKVTTVRSFEGIDLSSLIGLGADIDFGTYHDDPLKGLAVASGEDVYYESALDLKNDKRMVSILEDALFRKSVYDGKATIYALRKLGIKLRGIEDDILLAAYLLDSSTASKPEQVFSSFGVDISGAPEEGQLSLFDDNPADSMRTGRIAYHALHLREKARNSLASVEALKLYTDVELPLMAVLAGMELEGFPVHEEKLREFGAKFRAERDEAAKEVYDIAGRPFNINSPQQVASVLYDELGLKGPKDRSTSVDVLEKLEGESPIIPKILEYRKYAKLLGTYVDGLIPHIKPDGKIHTYFNQAQTSTGRLSSSSPNLQNISARDEESKQIRQAFYYDDEDTVLLSLDYGQIELRVLAALSGCKDYIEVFESGRDVHSETAKRIFHTEEVTPLERRRAKAVNFAIIYGSTDYGLADQIGTSVQEARGIIKSFYASYPEVGEYLDKVIKEATTKGYVTTMFGRRRYLREVNDPNYGKREAARRQALNAPVQGTAADIIKIAMVKIADFLDKGGYKTKMVLQIHDELIFAVPKEELKAIEPKLKDIMENAVPLPVRLVAEPGVGRTWYDAKD